MAYTRKNIWFYNNLPLICKIFGVYVLGFFFLVSEKTLLYIEIKNTKREKKYWQWFKKAEYFIGAKYIQRIGDKDFDRTDKITTYALIETFLEMEQCL